MNQDFNNIVEILLQLKKEYIQGFTNNGFNPNIPVTERDIVSEIYCRLKAFCKDKEIYSHTEIRPIANKQTKISELKNLHRFDNVILKNLGKNKWIDDAIYIQDKYKKGSIQARFSSVPIKFMHTVIEVKIQSDYNDSKKDIDKLKLVQDNNKDCNCIFVLLNARGKAKEHKKIIEYALLKNIYIIEYSFETEKNNTNARS